MSCTMTSGIARLSRLALVCAAAITAGSVSAYAATDTSRLPRLAGAKVLYASPGSTIFTSTDPLPRTFEQIITALVSEGWQPYESPTASTDSNPTLRILALRKGADALSLFITVAPAQGNATSVTYTNVVLANDLPFPKDATAIKFDPDKPFLSLATTQSVEASLDYFRDELRQRGWSLWSTKDNARQPAGGPSGEITQNGGHAYYVREDKRPLLLTLEKRKDDTGLDVQIKAIPAELLVRQSQREPEPAKPPQRDPAAEEAAAKAQQQFAQSNKAIDDQISKLTETILKDALSDIRGGKPKAEPQRAAAGGPPLTSLPDRSEPIPLPLSSEEIDFDGARGRLEFYNAASVGQVADYYRGALKPLGWQEKRTPINRENMVALTFSNGAKDLSITVMRMGQRSKVMADGSALKIATAAVDNKKPEQASTSDTTPEPVLEAEDRNGLPVPNKRSSVGSTKSLFRYEVNATVPARVDTVLAFYRRELGKREDWKELPQGSTVTPDKVRLAYATANGPAELVLERKSSDTVATLAIRKQAEAEKAGLLPKAGQVKLLFGNMIDKEAIITIGKQTVKVGGGVGGKKPDGPSIELPPGKHNYVLKIGGKQVETETIEIAAGDIWGMMVGPGGALAVQMY